MPSVSGMPASEAKSVSIRPTPARNQTIAAPPATWASVSRREVRVVSGTRKAPTTRAPTVTAAAASCTTRSTGRDHRTKAPGSPSSSGAAPPPKAVAATTATIETTPRIPSGNGVVRAVPGEEDMPSNLGNESGDHRIVCCHGPIEGSARDHVVVRRAEHQRHPDAAHAPGHACARPSRAPRRRGEPPLGARRRSAVRRRTGWHSIVRCHRRFRSDPRSPWWGRGRADD